MTKQGRELEKAKAILEKFVAAMPVQAGRELVAIVGQLADRVGRLERALLEVTCEPYRIDCDCARCRGLTNEVARALGLERYAIDKELGPVLIDKKVIDEADFS